MASVEVLENDGTTQEVAPTDKVMYEMLQDPTRQTFLKINSSLYKFDEAHIEGREKLDLVEKNSFFQMCQQAGLSNIQASTVSTILKQVQSNLP